MKWKDRRISVPEVDRVTRVCKVCGSLIRTGKICSDCMRDSAMEEMRRMVRESGGRRNVRNDRGDGLWR